MSGIDTSAHVGANGLQVGPEMLEGEPLEDAGMWLTPEDNMAKHHHPCTPIETPRSESELSFDFHYPTDSDEEEDPAVDLTKVAFGVIYVPTKHFKARKPLKTPVWQQMCRPSPLPKRLPKQHPSYEDEEKRILREMAATKRIEIEQAVVERKKYDRSRENSHEWVQGQVWMEREMELRWELISSTYRLSEKSISKRTKRENEFSLELVREAIVELKTLLKMKPTHPNGRMLIIRCIGRLPHKERVAMYGPSYTVDWIYRANPKTSWKTPFLNHRVPRTKLYDPQYRVLASHEAPPMAWLHYMDIKVDEGISDAREQEVRVDDEQEFVEYVEENCIDSVLEFLKTREGKMMVSTVANRLSSRDKQYRRKRFWMWFKGQGQAKVLKAKFAVWFSHYDVLGVGRLGFDSLRAFMKDELCVPVDDEEFTNLAIMLDDSIPQGGTRGVGALLKRKKTVSSAFYATFNTIYLWFAQLTGWPVEEKTKIKKKARSSKPKRAKSSVSLKYVSEKEHAASQKKLKRKKALKRITTSKYKGIATKTILAQVRRHARASAMERFREVHRPSGMLRTISCVAGSCLAWIEVILTPHTLICHTDEKPLNRF
eukprot:g5346.t1